MNAPALDPRTVDFLRSVPVGVTTDGETLIVGDGEIEYRVTPEDNLLVVEWVLRAVPRETVRLATGSTVLDPFLIVSHANAWRGAHDFPLLDLWGQQESSPEGLTVVEEKSGWSVTLADAPLRLLAAEMRQAHAARLARALALPLETLLTAVQDPEGGGVYGRVPPPQD
ncbi:hypothetical protein J1G42_02925 [Cellulomonas sp. zg-ZUI222]|uniref:hypothetical protein n=1 Tax=Cellulomonas wangleii TaxID=2816956 RepID=UPI001A94CE26|nr:hypothetical protein [Cellulomonas wangleii]MBO0919778.1 hypothetical protein [Cellulomonas wangleii]